MAFSKEKFVLWELIYIRSKPKELMGKAKSWVVRFSYWDKKKAAISDNLWVKRSVFIKLQISWLTYKKRQTKGSQLIDYLTLTAMGERRDYRFLVRSYSYIIDFELFTSLYFHYLADANWRNNKIRLYALLWRFSRSFRSSKAFSRIYKYRALSLIINCYFLQ